MTRTAPRRRSVAWSSRPVDDGDLTDVLGFFLEPDFFFRTARPDTLGRAAVTALLGEDTHLLCADGEAAGLWAVEEVGGAHGCHYQLHLRLRSDAPDDWWRVAYREVVAALRNRIEVVRLTVTAGEFDHRWTRLLRELDLSDEGVLADVVLHGGRRCGYRYFSQIWTDRA